MNENGGNPFDDIETVLQGTHAAPATKTDTAFVFVVERGPDTGKRLRVSRADPSPVLIGQSSTSALGLTDRLVSRRHLALEIDGGSVRLRDLDSTNGTRVDGVRVVEALLEGGEQLAIGDTRIRVQRERDTTISVIPEETRFHGLVGASEAMRRLYPVLQRIADSMIPVILEGETGTGKEVAAEAIHEASARAEGPFVVFDCTAAAATLLESELFGHERGAFTGAHGARQGVFQQAHGGTLLIDEIGDLDLSLQPKLLRAIERSEVRPVGGTRSIKVDVRVIAATRRDLDREVQEGRFRDDLFHRLAVARIELPPLRRRKGDVTVLARRFWADLARTSERNAGAQPPAALLARWERDSWPGNVRQLRNSVARTLALGVVDSDIAETDSGNANTPVGDFMAQVIAGHCSLPVARARVVDEFERRYLEEALATHGGSVVRAAKESGIALRYFQLLRKRRGTTER